MFFKDDNKVKINNAQVSTFVGADTRVEGTVITKSSIRIDGEIVGGVVTDATVILSKNGHIEGNVIADNIVIAGVVNGNLQINDRTNIEPTGEVYGDISTGRVLIDENSIFQGNCSMNIANRKPLEMPAVEEEKEETVVAETEEKKEVKKDEEKIEASKETVAVEKEKKAAKGNKELKVEILE